jgi:hypothetical protein
MEKTNRWYADKNSRRLSTKTERPYSLLESTHMKISQHPSDNLFLKKIKYRQLMAEKNINHVLDHKKSKFLDLEFAKMT